MSCSCSQTEEKEVVKGKSEIIDLDNVMLSAEVGAAWHAFAQAVVLASQPLGISPDDIPDEQGRLEDDGSLTIFVVLPGAHGELSMTVPPEHWARKQ